MGKIEPSSKGLPPAPRTGSLEGVAESTYRLPWGHPEGWPAVPNGAHGRLRAAGENLLGADTDREAVSAWLSHKGAKSPATLQAYRREVTRLLLWAAEERRSALSDLTSTDYQMYKAFLANPQPRERWVAENGKKRAICDPQWKPFYGSLAPKSQAYALHVARDLLNYLASAGYLKGNPLAFMALENGATEAARDQAARSGRRKALSRDDWAAIKETINQMPEGTAAQRFQKARARWVFGLLFATGARISDLRGTFGDLHADSVEGREVWIWSIQGKGGKFAQLPLPSPVVQEMRRVRRAMGIPALPLPGESTPLVPREAETNRNRPQTRQGLDRIIKGVLRAAADRLDGDGVPDQAERIRCASAHSLRHTAARDLLDSGAPMRVASELLRHADQRTTQGYTAPEVQQMLDALNRRSLHWD